MKASIQWVQPAVSQNQPPLQTRPFDRLLARMEGRLGITCLPLRTVRRNSIVCNQGDRLPCLYFVKQGEVVLTRLSTDGRELLLSILRQGEFFGEGALLNGSVANFSAYATRPTTLIQLSRAQFNLLLDDAAACREILSVVARRCDDAWTQLEVLGCAHARDKVHAVLLWLTERVGIQTPHGVRVDMNLTQLARMVGCARETLTRQVSALRKSGAVRIRADKGKRSLYVLDRQSLTCRGQGRPASRP